MLDHNDGDERSENLEFELCYNLGGGFWSCGLDYQWIEVRQDGEPAPTELSLDHNPITIPRFDDEPNSITVTFHTDVTAMDIELKYLYRLQGQSTWSDPVICGPYWFDTGGDWQNSYGQEILSAVGEYRFVGIRNANGGDWNEIDLYVTLEAAQAPALSIVWSSSGRIVPNIRDAAIKALLAADRLNGPEKPCGQREGLLTTPAADRKSRWRLLDLVS